jgi:hypothetical protein
MSNAFMCEEVYTEKCWGSGAVESELLSYHDNWLHGTGHSPHTPITQNIAWLAYPPLTTPRGPNPNP